MSEHLTLPALPVQDGVQFRHVPGFPGYSVGDDGSVWSWRALCDRRDRRQSHWLLLKPRLRKGTRKGIRDRIGYLVVGLTREGRRHDRSVHRLVLEGFVGPCPPGMEACHSPDPDPRVNRLDNLRWDTPENNAADKRRHGTHLEGSAVLTAKLDESDIPKILRLLEAGVACHRIAYGFGVSERQVFSISKGHAWKRLTDTSQRGLRQCFSS